MSPKKLINEFNKLEFDLQFRISEDESFLKEALNEIPNHERIDYWFLPK
ncbi:MAG: hypothetical protein N3A69_03385 [Leptospiraceae bacterium]|nr:hypothetical protein [Leptospiraceae bacterium]